MKVNKIKCGRDVQVQAISYTDKNEFIGKVGYVLSMKEEKRWSWLSFRFLPTGKTLIGVNFEDKPPLDYTVEFYPEQLRRIKKMIKKCSNCGWKYEIQRK